MAEHDIAKTEYPLKIEAEYHNRLNIEGFMQMLKDPSFCYKYYWLEALVHLISEGRIDTDFNEVIDEMISNAWYSVLEFHIHLSGIGKDGVVKDGLERAVTKLHDISHLPANASRVEIHNAIREHDGEIKREKEQLTNMVPYRALAGFFTQTADVVPWDSAKRITAYILEFNRSHITLPYVLGDSSRLKKEIHINPVWAEMIQDNTVQILGWIQFEKIKWLQNNNPEVPGLVYKLTPMDEKMRKLNHVRNLWNAVLEIRPVADVFTGKELIKGKYDVDHFIPWSFVMNDELWNLMPMDPGLNSAKSNRLPVWDPFFGRFGENQFLLYCLLHEKEGIHQLFDKCYKDNLHSIWASQELYRAGHEKQEFLTILSKNMQPVYDSARRQGYELWRM